MTDKPTPAGEVEECPHARSDMTPCYLKDGEMCLTNRRECVGCGISADALDKEEAPSGEPEKIEMAIALDEANRVYRAGEPHEFKGRQDRDCEVCGRPDRAIVHTAPPPPEGDGVDKRERDWEASYDDLGMSFLALGNIVIEVCASIRARPEGFETEDDVPDQLLAHVPQRLEDGLSEAEKPSPRKYLPAPPWLDPGVDDGEAWLQWREEMQELAPEDHVHFGAWKRDAHISFQAREIARLERRVIEVKCLHSDAFTDWQNADAKLKHIRQVVFQESRSRHVDNRLA